MTREVRLSEIVSVLARIRTTGSRNEKVGIAAEFLKSCPQDQLADVARLMIGQLLPSELGSPGLQLTDLEDARSIKSQTSLFKEQLTVPRVVATFKEIYSTTGKRGRQKKAGLLRGLLIDASKDEMDFLIGCITGEIRAGFSEGLLIESIASASGRDINGLKETFGIVTDVGRLAESALRGDRIASRMVLKPMSPIKVMLAESAENVQQALSLIPLPAAAEYKLDGIRVQVHIKGGEVRIFSRHQIDITNALPEIVSAVKIIEQESAIFDGEVVAFKGRPLPFQEVMRRVTRERDVMREAEVTPVRLFLFDVLYLNGEPLIDKPYRTRSDRLRSVAPELLLVPKAIVSTEAEAERFFKKSFSEGHEGVMIKSLSGKYQLGRRASEWIKVKKYSTIDAVILAAEWGHGRRSNWLSNYHLGVRKDDDFAMVGKTFKGVSDAELKRLTDLLLIVAEEDHGSWIRVRPEIVLEVAFNEIQRSSKYDSGMALRFARVVKIREDKTADEATTLEELKQLMERQYRLKAKRIK